MAIASDFVQPTRREFPTWVRYGSYAAVCGLGVPVVKTMEWAGLRPLGAIIRRIAKSIGDFGEYRPTAHDIFVCAGFKSGTTWMLQIAVQIAFRGEAEFDNIHCVVPWPDAPPPFRRRIIPLTDESPVKRSPTGLRVIKTHHLQTRVPYCAQARYIALVRDPKDVIVSAYHFLRALAYGPLMPSVEHWVDLFLSRDTPAAGWASHLASYWRVRDYPNILFLTYEELQQAPRENIARIANFLGVPLNCAQLDAVVYTSSFEQMRAHCGKFDPGRVVPWGREHYMIRRGQTGTAHELLSTKMQRRIDDHCRGELQALGCDFPYDQAFVKRR
jgi:aryl sulfotransferase